MKVALYGGSFNPPHLGHVSAAETVAKEIMPDKFIIFPDNIPPHKQLAENSPSPQERLEMCIFAFGHITGAEISGMELERAGRSYTADTIALLRERFPDDELVLVLGSDMLLTFTQWYRFEYILKECMLAVVSREHNDIPDLEACAQMLRENYSADVRILEHEVMEMSSMQIRKALQSGKGKEYLPEKVYEYIMEHHFYGI